MRSSAVSWSRRSSLLVVSIGLFVLTACAGDGGTEPVLPSLLEWQSMDSRAAATCTNVSGTIVGNVLPPPGELFPVPSVVTGDLAGLVTAYAAPQDEQMGQGSVHLATFHLFIPDGGGLIWTEDAGVMAPSNPPYFRLNNRYGVVGGDGPWSGASGFLQVQGTLVIDYEDWSNPENGAIDATYHGRLCRPAGFTGG